jgi:hypothetical protein
LYSFDEKRPNDFFSCQGEIGLLFCIKFFDMALGVNFSKDGYLQLKKDRDVLIQKISELQSVLDDFNFAYPFLESLFEPNVITYIKDENYYGELNIPLPYVEDPMKLEFEIGSVSDYSGDKDHKLIDDFKRKSEEVLRTKFPINFQ